LGHLVFMVQFVVFDWEIRPWDLCSISNAGLASHLEFEARGLDSEIFEENGRIVEWNPVYCTVGLISTNKS
jgi:hypothetical protein